MFDSLSKKIKFIFLGPIFIDLYTDLQTKKGRKTRI